MKNKFVMFIMGTIVALNFITTTVYATPIAGVNKFLIESIVPDEVMDTNLITFSAEEYTGYTSTTLNVREQPDINSDSLFILPIGEKVTYRKTSEPEWYAYYDNEFVGFICTNYIIDRKYIKSIEVNSSGFKSYLPYKAFKKSSKQYELQSQYAYTGKYGIRTVGDRLCVAIGQASEISIGQYVDLELENGTIIPCVVGDVKAQKDTDSSNMRTKANGCASEFIVETSKLPDHVRLSGNISDCHEDWKSPVKRIKLYNDSVFN